MQIKLRGDNEDGDVQVVLTQEHLSNYNFIDLLIWKDDEEKELLQDITLPLDELKVAINAFAEKNDISSNRSKTIG